ncbi:MAG: mechanosensitive ion channel family protein [Bacillota bacterium]
MANLFPLAFQTTSTVINLAIAIGIFLAFFIFQKMFLKNLFGFLARFIKTIKQDADDPIVLAFEKPMSLLFILLGIYFALNYLPLTAPQNIVVLKVFRSFLIIIIALGFFNLVDNHSLIGRGLENIFGVKFESILYPFVSKTMKVIIGALTISIIAGEWDYDINGFVAGLGLGGLAFALAAKDTVANIFGGFVIVTDKPFTIGDWIQTPTIEGTVEDINFRSTRVRTFAQALITIPNSLLANEPITNWSRMGKRRINFRLRLPYNIGKEQLENSVTNIRHMLEGHTGISQETIFVRLDGFDDNGYGILLYFFTKTTNWGEYLRIKEDVNYKIIHILEGEGVSIALPSTVIYKGEEGRLSETNFLK